LPSSLAPKLGTQKLVLRCAVGRERLTMRVAVRLFACLTTAFSRELARREHAVALYLMRYDFARMHLTLRVIPAMKAGILT